ncbi:MAG TPA: phosphatidate cytidylyltransferase [Kofleriaceae bacterium]|nr:phosphatidate cytidylyltransferase [Kofleriaceae bacterium]
MALGNLAQRFLVAVVAVPVLLLILSYHRHEPTWALIFAASLIAMYEFFAMTLPKEDRVAALVIGAIACIGFYWLDATTVAQLAPSEWTYYKPHSLGGDGQPSFGFRMLTGAVMASPAIVLGLVVIVPALYYLFRFRDIPSVAGRITATISGIVYAGFLTTFLAMLKRMTLEGRGTHDQLAFANAVPVVIVLVVAWLADTGGYFAGRFLGNAKLYPAVSPKKTWAGAWGGIAGSVLGVLVLKLFYPELLSWLDVFLIAIPGGMLGQMGDLAESLIKRSVGVKDSGALLPGHGGILDRIDAVLFIAPYVYAYLRFKQAL